MMNQDCNCDCHDEPAAPLFSADETRRHAAIDMAGRINACTRRAEDLIGEAQKIEQYLRGTETK